MTHTVTSQWGIASIPSSKPLNSEVEWDRAFKDALRSIRTIPDPAVFAATMDLRHVEALSDAIYVKGGWIIADPSMLPEMRLLGIVEAKAGTQDGRYLTAFGMRVLKAIKDHAL